MHSSNSNSSRGNSSRGSSRGALSAGRPSDRNSRAVTLASLAGKAATVRVNFDLDRDLHIRLKLYATRQGKPIKAVLSDYIAQLPG